MSQTEAVWQPIARRKKQEQSNLIPKDWTLKTRPAANRNDVLAVPRECGLLSDQEIQITENYDATTLVKELAARRLKSVDVVTAFCKRAAIAQQLTSCLTEIMFEEAIFRANQLDEHLERTGKPIGPLHGLPISVKDSFKIVGKDASIGYASLCFKPAETNSALVEMLLQAGAVIHCKTNIPLTLQALDSHNNVFGRVLNPANLKLTAGGSSGGEGALVAMRGSVLGVGTDVGGSIRIPAMCNGLVGVKPSHGRIPYSGQENGSLPGTEALGIRSVAGPIAHTVRDCELFFKAIGDQEPWIFDPECVPQTWEQQIVRSALRTPSLSDHMRRLRVGIVKTDGITTPLPPIQAVMEEISNTLERNAAIEVIELDITSLLSQCQTIANGLFGVDGANTAFDLMEATSEPISPWLSKRLRRKANLTAEKIRDLQARRNALQTRFLDIWRSGGGYWKDDTGSARKLDVFICPIAPHPTPAVDSWNTVSYTSSFNLLDYPAATLPIRPVRVSDLNGNLSDQSAAPNGWEKYNRKLWDGDRSVFLGGTLCVQVISQCRQERVLLQAMTKLKDSLAVLKEDKAVKPRL
ncbi:amidase [Aureobasidium pullulans]|uniref:amidase n=1 Tax=Aureobasidium pullulans TaxID=5580 RepID=A0A4S9D3P8_AURPU|nr:amidase [Aureobasidium pullulans]